ncbi:MAG: hypothetical protein Q4E88_06020 [Coriobacteriia bacterium]|nr:hypothetical protein [Coriobacteriia bacterium]
MAKRLRQKKTKEEKSLNNPKQNIQLISNRRIKRDELKTRNGGYLFIKSSCKDLGLDKICKNIQKKEALKYDLFEVLSHIIYNKILNIYESTSTYDFSQTLIELPKFTKKDIAQSQAILAKYNVQIQKKLYSNITKITNPKQDCIFYDCSNNSIVNNRILNSCGVKYPQDVVTLSMFMFDSNAFPCAFTIESNINQRYYEYSELNRFIYKLFSEAVMYVCPESIHSINDGDLYGHFRNHHELSLQQLSNFNPDLLDWSIDPKGWHMIGSNKNFNLLQVENKINNENTSEEIKTDLQNTIFYKHKKVKISIPDSNKHITQNLIVLFNFELRDWQNTLRENEIQDVQKKVESKIGGKNNKAFAEKYKHLLRSETVNFNGVDTEMYYFTDRTFRKNQEYDGYYAICENSGEDHLEPIIEVVTNCEDQLKYLIQSVKKDYDPKLTKSQEDNIIAHYLTSVISYSAFRYILFRLDYKCTYMQLYNTLQNFKFYKLANAGWIPAYVPNETSDALKNLFNIDTDFEYINNQDMKTILKNI